MDDRDDRIVANVRDRDVLGGFIGRKILDITQHDDRCNEGCYIMFMIEGGRWIKIPIGEDGFCFGGVVEEEMD